MIPKLSLRIACVIMFLHAFRHTMGLYMWKNPKSLIRVCKIDEMFAALEYVLVNIQAKEVAMGYEKIWNIGE